MVIRGTIGADAVLARFPRHTRYEPMLVKASARSKAPLVPMGCQIGAPGSTSMILDRSMHLGIPKPFCVDVVRGRCPQQHKAWADAGTGIRVHQGIVGVDGV